jgi:hypothetical protein
MANRHIAAVTGAPLPIDHMLAALRSAPPGSDAYRRAHAVMVALLEAISEGRLAFYRKGSRRVRRAREMVTA